MVFCATFAAPSRPAASSCLFCAMSAHPGVVCLVSPHVCTPRPARVLSGRCVCFAPCLLARVSWVFFRALFARPGPPASCCFLLRAMAANFSFVFRAMFACLGPAACYLVDLFVSYNNINPPGCRVIYFASFLHTRALSCHACSICLFRVVSAHSHVHALFRCLFARLGTFAS